MKRIVLHMAVVFGGAAFGGDLDVARQALADGMWGSALAVADKVSANPAVTNAMDRTAARLISLEALAHMEQDAEIRRRLAGWKEETSERFRYWKARSLIRVGDFDQAQEVLKRPFSDPSLALPVASLKAALLVVSGKYQEALDEMSGKDVVKAPGLAGEDARLIVAEALSRTGKLKAAQELLASLAKDSTRHEIKIRAGYLLGFSEMDVPSTYTTGVARVRSILRANPGVLQKHRPVFFLFQRPCSSINNSV